MIKLSMNDVTRIILDMVKSNKDILKILYHDVAAIDIYNQPELDIPEAQKVIEDKILTKRKEFSDDYKCCYMILRYGEKNYHEEKNIFFNGNTFDIYILCHNDIIINDHIGDRTCEIERLVEETFDNKPLKGVACKCKVLWSESRDLSKTNYSGRHVKIEFKDFNGRY